MQGGSIMWFRIFSGTVLSIVVFFAMRAIGMEPGSARAVASVPLISAAINIMTGPIFSVSAMAGIAFIIMPLLPVSYWLGSDVVAAIRGLPVQAKSYMEDSVVSAPSAATSLARRLADIEAACASGMLTPTACDEAKHLAIQSISQALGIGEATEPRLAN